MSEILNNMKTRRSIRGYKPDMVPQDMIERKYVIIRIC